MIVKKKMTASMDGDFVVFLIGMRLNQLWKVHKWLPVALAMGRMMRELRLHPELGFLHVESWFGRTSIQVQYWRSLEQLMLYATNRDLEHLPAWVEFNRSIGDDGSVGIWHETYCVTKGGYETVYRNMPAFGLQRAGAASPARGERESASGRLSQP